MTLRPAMLASAGCARVLVELVDARGSTPREAGAAMLVTAEAVFGTIGGGQLEYLAHRPGARGCCGRPDRGTC